MDLQITFEDPKAYMKPWTIEVKASYIPDTELLEYVCAENEKDARHLVGHVDDEKKGEVRISNSVLAPYAGVYRVRPLGDLQVSVEGERLLVELPGGGGKQPTFAVADDRFVFPAIGATLEFVRDTSGAVSHMMFRIVEGDQRAERISDR